MTLVVTILCMLLTVSAGAGCNKEKGKIEYRMSDINVNKSSVFLNVGQSEQLIVSPIPAVASQLKFHWISANNAVATVVDGLIKAEGAGETTITVRYQNIERNIAVKVSTSDMKESHALLYEKQLSNRGPIPELIDNGFGAYTADGLKVTANNNIVKLDKFYAVAERKVQYKVIFSADAKAIFRSSEGDFNAHVDVQGKRISIATNPVTEKTISFLQADREYLVEVYHVYQQAKLRIVDTETGEAGEITAEHDGQGGVGKGVLQPGFAVGMQWDHYCFGLVSGSFMLVKKISVYALKKKVKLLMYGDSITQPEGYFPKKNFPESWTQQIIRKLNGNAMSSGRGGAQIDMVLDYIKNELPYIDAKYVMVTIGTNGGNTEDKLIQLVDYITSQGAIPILNNIPSNESGTQISVNEIIQIVRKRKGLKGVRFDVATSLLGDGKEVDKTTMYWEDYTGSYGWQIYHHPNEKGGKKMFVQSLEDIPEIFE